MPLLRSWPVLLASKQKHDLVQKDDVFSWQCYGSEIAGGATFDLAPSLTTRIYNFRAQQSVSLTLFQVGNGCAAHSSPIKTGSLINLFTKYL
ncbi:MAG TPA: hypothetical protein VEI53_05130 [Ktedonobacteraceae bacterium]|nr:hypothetical protein [Ktedonobacteraceae bacterium]HYB02547.1 hypothetical protein [Ktedonobacteraceae bacterium]